MTMTYEDLLNIVFPEELTLALDRASVRSLDVDGHLHVAASVLSAAEVDNYIGYEIPGYKELGLNKWGTYSVFRDPGELEKAVSSFAGKPLLSIHRPLTANDHPFNKVVGSVMNPFWKEPYVIAELVVWEASAIEAITSGDCDSLSAGYRYTPVLDNNSWNGKKFQIRMKDIYCNHVALVAEPRVSAAVVGDNANRRAAA
jgi:uncharacterized protein